MTAPANEGGGFADRDEAQRPVAGGEDYSETGPLHAVDPPVGSDSSSPGAASLGAPGSRSAYGAPPVASGAHSAVAAAGIGKWLPIAGAGSMAALAGGWMLWGAFSKPVEAPAPAPAPRIERPVELLPPKPPVPPIKIPVAAVQETAKTRADEVYEKGLHAPLMAAQPGAGAAAPVQRPAAADPNMQVRQTAAATSLSYPKVKARYLGDPTFRLSVATPIQCILDTAMDTTQAGMVRCHLESDVYSANSTVVLLEKGTILAGDYQADLKQGQERVGVIWKRAETPNSIVVDLDSRGTDALGRAGVDGKVETYFWTRFGAAVMFSVLSDVGTVARAWAQSQLTQGGGSNTYVYGNVGGNTQQGVNQVIGESLRSSTNIPPVLIKNQGERVSVLLSRDLDFSDVYGLERR